MTSMYSLLVFFMLAVSVASGLALLPCHGKTTTQKMAIDNSGSEKRAGTDMLTSGLNNDGEQEQPQSGSTPCSDVPEIVDENQLLVATAKSRDSAAGSTVVSGTPKIEKLVRPIGHQISNKDVKTGDVVRSGESSMSGQSRRQRRSATSAAEAAEGGALLAWDKRPRYYRENDGGASTRDWRTNMMRVWGKRANGINPRRQKGPNRGGYTAG